MINEKSYQIIAVDILGNTEVICTCLTYDIAENLMFKLQQGDEFKFSPCAYTIEEINNEG